MTGKAGEADDLAAMGDQLAQRLLRRRPEGLRAVAGCVRGWPMSGQTAVTGLVHVGPQSPVETAGHPGEDQPAANVTVTISEQVPGDAHTAGEVVAHASMDADRRTALAVTLLLAPPH